MKISRDIDNQNAIAYINNEGKTMKNVLKLDLEGLPEEARDTIIDFYEYLKSKYHTTPKKTSKPQKDLFSLMKKGLYNLPAGYKFDRDELYDLRNHLLTLTSLSMPLKQTIAPRK